jgi:hypothetical protein
MPAQKTSAGELRQAAANARAFADLARSAETKDAFEQLALRWEREAEQLEAAAVPRSQKDER